MVPRWFLWFGIFMLAISLASTARVSHHQGVLIDTYREYKIEMTKHSNAQMILIESYRAAIQHKGDWYDCTTTGFDR